MTSPEMPAHPEWPTTTPDVVEEAHRCIAKRQKTVRGCPSRKDIKAGPHRKIVIDEVFGLLTATGRAPDDRKHRRVHVHCACGRDGRCRFDELCRGIAKSHGCLEDQAFRKIFGGLAAGVDRGKKTAIFTDIMSGMSYFDIAAKHRVQRYVVDFVRRQEYGRLERLPLDRRDRIADVSQANFAHAIRLSRMTRAEVQAVCILQKQQIAASAKAAAAGQHKFVA